MKYELHNTVLVVPKIVAISKIFRKKRGISNRNVIMGNLVYHYGDYYLTGVGTETGADNQLDDMEKKVKIDDEIVNNQEITGEEYNKSEITEKDEKKDLYYFTVYFSDLEGSGFTFWFNNKQEAEIERMNLIKCIEIYYGKK